MPGLLSCNFHSGHVAAGKSVQTMILSEH